VIGTVSAPRAKQVEPLIRSLLGTRQDKNAGLHTARNSRKGLSVTMKLHQEG
jgi:hypothetical protein